MADVKKNKKNEKTVNISMPKTLAKKKIDFDGPVIHSQSRKSRSVESRSYSNEKKKRSGISDYQQINLDKLDLPDKYSEQKRYASNSSLGSLSPNKRYSQIPIPSRFQMNQRPVSPVKTRSPSPIKKSPRLNKGKVFSVEPELNLKKLRDTSPIKKIGFVRSSTPKVDSKPKPFFSSRKEDKISDARTTVPRSPKKKSSKTTLTNERSISPVKRVIKAPFNPQKSKSKYKIVEETSIPNSPIERTKTANQILGERSSTFEGLNVPDSTSLDLFGDLCPSKGSFFDLDVKKSDTGMYIPVISCHKSSSVIRTVSGHELVLTPSVEKAMEEDGLGDIVYSQLLKETEEKFDEKFNKLEVFHDDANEYDSEATTDSIPIYASRKEIDLDERSHDIGNKSKAWKKHEDDILNDVLYRQSVYHPAVIRQKNQEERSMLDCRLKSGSIEDSIGRSTQNADNRSFSKNNFKRKQSPSSWNRNPGVSNLRSWSEKNIELNCKEVCKELEKIQDIPSSLVNGL